MNRCFLAIVVSIMLVGCQLQSKDSDAAKTVGASETPKSMPVVRRTIPFMGTFYQITNVSDFDIVFTPGDYNVEVEGPEALLGALNSTVDSGIITFSQSEGGKSSSYISGKTNGLGTIYVSCPQLQILAVCSGGSFRSEGTIHTPSLHVGMLSTASIDMDSVCCDDRFIYETSNDGNASFSSIQAGGDVTMYMSDNGTVRADIQTPGTLFVNTGAKSVSYLNGRASRVDMISLGHSDCRLGVAADKLVLSAQDQSHVEISARYKQHDIKQGRNARVTETL